MSEELKFPVKYAVLELKREGGYSTGYEPITEGFIVSKCLVVESKVRYFANGESAESYKVYFPYNNIAAAKYFYEHCEEGELHPYREQRQNLHTNAQGEYCQVEVVSDVFDTYEEAKAVAESENEKLESEIGLSYSILDPNFERMYERDRKRLAHTLEVCRMYEQFITENTKDMEVTPEVKVGSKLERKKGNN